MRIYIKGLWATCAHSQKCTVSYTLINYITIPHTWLCSLRVYVLITTSLQVSAQTDMHIISANTLSQL